MSLFASVDDLPYQTSQECQNALLGIEAIDYFFARQIVNRQQTLMNSTLSSKEYREVFHVLIALSFCQRQGSVCISLPKIATQSFWHEALSHDIQEQHGNIESAGDVSIITSEKGYCFSELTILLQSLTKFIHGLPKNTYLVLEDNRLYSKRYWQYEQNLCQYIAQNLTDTNLQRWQAHISLKQFDIASKMKLMFTSLPFENSEFDFQQLSVLNSLYSPFSIITGGAGTGKTYTIARLAVLLCEIRDIPASAIEMAAPTGKAANRLAQSLNNELLTLSEHSELTEICNQLSAVEPKTISRLLKINPSNGMSAYNPQRPLSAKIVIVDETSMIDISLMNKLINSMSENTQLILVGDPNQLPSVETGCLLADLVSHPIGSLTENRWKLLQQVYPALEDANAFVMENLVNAEKYGKSAVTRLSRMRRSSIEIAEFAQAVLASNSEKALSLIDVESTSTALNSSASKSAYQETSKQFDLWSESKELAIQIKPFSGNKAGKKFAIKQNLEDALSKDIIHNFSALFAASSVEQAFLAMKKYALLTPFRKSLLGTQSLNQLIEQQLSRRYDWIEPNKLYKCKPIMILQNDYQLSLFNGDLGLIWEDDNNQKFAYFETAKGLVKYPIYNLPAFDLNYSMTIHKTQGSEFEAVDIILPNLNSDFLNKQLLYTGITRAQLKVRLFTDPATLTQVINRSADRISGIDSNLSKAIVLLS